VHLKNPKVKLLLSIGQLLSFLPLLVYKIILKDLIQSLFEDAENKQAFRIQQSTTVFDVLSEAKRPN